MANKNKIRVNVVAWDSYELDGDLSKCIAKLNSLITYNPNLFDFTIDIETESGYYNSCSTNILIYAYRWETDDEFNERIVASKKKSEAAKLAAKRRAEANEKREKSLYESLKRKFEKEIEETSNPQNP